MDKYQNKYRTPTARATWWNYANTGFYFITICTDNREHYFGKIQNGKMILSEIGLMVQQEWDKSFKIRAELVCDVFVIMPNHIHAILRIVVNPHGRADVQHGRAYIPQSHGVAYRPPKSISSFVAGFKSAATKRINEFRKMPKSPVWQHRFHDHIIRNESEYVRIKQYILENPKNWGNDMAIAGPHGCADLQQTGRADLQPPLPK